MTCWNIIPLIFTATRRLLSHLNEENETQGERITCPRSPSWLVRELGLDPSILWLQSLSFQAPILILPMDPPEKTTQLRVSVLTLALVLALSEARLT